MIDTAITLALALVAGILTAVSLGFIHGKYRQWRGDDVEVTNVTGALIAAQNKRLDIEDRHRSDEEDTS